MNELSGRAPANRLTNSLQRKFTFCQKVQNYSNVPSNVLQDQCKGRVVNLFDKGEDGR
jgi:hypothetical protein